MWKVLIEMTGEEDEIIATFDDHPSIGYELSDSPNGFTDIFLRSESILDLTRYLTANGYTDLIEEITN